MLDSEPHCPGKSQPDWETGKAMENLTEPCFVCVTQDICRKRNECVQKDAWATPDDLGILSPAEGEKKDLQISKPKEQ